MIVLEGLRAITFDFGNTLVPVTAADLSRVIDCTAAWAVEHWPAVDAGQFEDLWREERDRQLREDVPLMREADLDRRATRVLARLRGAPPPDPDQPWDDAAAAELSEPAEIAGLLDAYRDAFLDTVAAPPEIVPMLERLTRRWRLGVISNWPLAEIVELYLERAGWRACFQAVVVSQTVGWIKPDRRIFEVAATQLGVPSGPAILHVGDDLGADVGGPKALGWQTAWLRDRPADSPLPRASHDPAVQPDVVLERITDLEAAICAGDGPPYPRPS